MKTYPNHQELAPSIKNFHWPRLTFLGGGDLEVDFSLGRRKLDLLLAFATISRSSFFPALVFCSLSKMWESLEVWVIGRNYEWRFIHQEGFGQPALMAFVVRSHLGSVGLLGKPRQHLWMRCVVLFPYISCPIWLMNLGYDSRYSSPTLPFNFSVCLGRWC